MPLAERKRRWENLMSLVSRGDVDTWRDSFVTALRAVTSAGARPGARP
jgi:trehalose-6-phosphate synthase